VELVVDPVDDDVFESPETVWVELVTGGVGDFVWLDSNFNGLQDPGEPGVPGVTVTLTGPGLMTTTTTDNDGHYLFDTPGGTGPYQITFTPPSKYGFTLRGDTPGRGDDSDGPVTDPFTL